MAAISNASIENYSAGLRLGGNALVLGGSTAPEGVITAPAGSSYHHDGGMLYRKATGTGNTGWVAQVDQTMLEVGTATPPVGWYGAPSNVISLGAVAPTSGQVSYLPWDVGPLPITIDQLAIFCSTAQSGGTTLTKAAIYSSTPDGALPVIGGGPLAQTTLTLTATGTRTGSVALTLQPARYWLAALYYASAAPTTSPQVYACNVSSILPMTSISTVSRGLSISGVTDLPTTGTFAFIGNTSGVVAFPRRSA